LDLGTVRGLVARRGTRVGAIGLQDARVFVVVQVHRDNFFYDALADVLGFDRKHGLHAPLEVPRHPVGAAQEHTFFRTFAEDENAAVLEEPVDDAVHSDVLRYSRQAGSQAADAADQEVDRDAGLAGLVEGFDRPAVDERINLGDDASLFAFAGPAGLFVDQLKRAALQVAWSDHEFLPLMILRIAGEQ